MNSLKRTGTRFAEKGNFKKALEYFNKALENEPKNIRTKVNICYCLMGMGRYKNALKEINNLLKRNPRDKRAKSTLLMNKGICLYNLGKHFEGNEATEEGINMRIGGIKKKALLIGLAIVALAIYMTFSITRRIYDDKLIRENEITPEMMEMIFHVPLPAATKKEQINDFDL